LAVGNVLSLSVNGTVVSYTVKAADIGSDAVSTRNRVAMALVNAINLAAPRLTPMTSATVTTTTEVSTLAVQPTAAAASVTMSTLDARLKLSTDTKHISVQGQFVVGDTLSVTVTVNGTAKLVSYHGRYWRDV
ncbi:hypothetical protein JZU57_02240, partial [bacterium]|nr:hypothetical protein [bacterium]